jgi:hypothetical protein
VRFVEDGLRAHGVAKVIPGAALLAEAYAAMKRGAAAKEALREELARLNAEAVEAPADLVDLVRGYLGAHPTASWATAVAAIAEARPSAARME